MKELRDSLGNLFFWAIAFGALLALVWLFGCVGPPDRVVLHAYTHEGEGDTTIITSRNATWTAI